MPLIIFSFAFNPETKEATFSGNVEADVALTILQRLVVAQAVQRAASQAKAGDKKSTKKTVAKARQQD